MLQPLSPLSRFATNVSSDKTQILSLTVSYERTQTKTNNCTTIYLRSQYTLFATTFYFFILSILHYCSELPSLIDIQIRSDRTVRFLDFQQTDFNDFAGVGISTSCFCLNYHNFPYLRLLPLLPTVLLNFNDS